MRRNEPIAPPIEKSVAPSRKWWDSYNNYTKYKDEPHWSDRAPVLQRNNPEYAGQFEESTYWNSPKLWGNPPAEERYWSDPQGYQEGGPVKDRFGYDTKDPKWAVMESILNTIPPNIANRLDNTELPMTMAEQLIEYTNGDANAALQIVEKLNTQFNKTAQGNERVGDYWDYWTKSLPAIYNKK
jgi:hypothetical protein